MEIRFDKLEAALASLESALARPPANDLERDGVIKRFEFTFEQSWKVAKKVLARVGIEAQSPRGVIRELAAQGWIADVRRWMTFLEARNYSSHTYDESTAEWVFCQASVFLLAAKELAARLSKEATS